MKKLLVTIGCVGLIGGGTLFAAPSAHAGVGNCTSRYLAELMPGLLVPGHHADYPACLTGEAAICLRWGGSIPQQAACLVA
jgi:hypothetical protein